MAGQNTEKNLDYERGAVSATDLHDSVRRENPLSLGEKGNAGVLVLVISGFILIFGGGQLFSTVNGFSSSIYSVPHYVREPRPSLGGIDEAAADVAWIDGWMKEGKKLYSNCIACHQASGLGIPGQFPPLVGSEWVDGGSERLGAILLHGINGPLKVAGQTYNGLMPAWNSLSDEKLAQVLTYTKRTFGSLPDGADGVFTTEMLSAARQKYEGHPAPFTEAELLNIPADAELSGAKVDLQTGQPLAGAQ